VNLAVIGQHPGYSAMVMPTKLARLFAFGAVIGPVLDGFHTHSGTTFYPRPVVLRMAWWVPLLFGAAAVAIGLSHVRLDRLLRRPRPALSGPGVALGILGFAGFYFLSAFLPAASVAKLALLAAGYAVLFLQWDRTWQGLVLAVLTALSGCAVEFALSRAGAFGYLRPDVVGLPLWLPALYLLASLCVGNLGRKLLAPDLDLPAGG
jgi:hypothetical protein